MKAHKVNDTYHTAKKVSQKYVYYIRLHFQYIFAVMVRRTFA